MMPLAIVAKSYWASGRLGWNSLLWIGISVMAEFSRNQRRDFVTMALFLVALLALVHEIMPKRGTAAKPKPRHPPRGRGIIIGVASLAGGAALVPLLWYSRVYFSTQAAGKDVDPTRDSKLQRSHSRQPRDRLSDAGTSSATISATPARTSFIFPAT